MLLLITGWGPFNPGPLLPLSKSPKSRSESWDDEEEEDATLPTPLIPLATLDYFFGGGASFFIPPVTPSSGTDVLSNPPFFGPVNPGILMLIFSPSLREKSLLDPAGIVSFGSIPFVILSYFLKSSRPATKSNESFLSGNPTPTIAFCPLSLISTRAKKREESKHL